jgi:hypothetical protein
VPLTPERLEELIFGTERFRRFTQDSPVMPDVWIAYGTNPGDRLDLLLTPHVEASAPELGFALRERLGARTTREGRPGEALVAYNESYVVAELDFEELVKVALPLTHWWQENVWRTKADLSEAEKLRDPKVKKHVAAQLSDAGASGFGGDVSPDLLWLMRIVGRIEVERQGRRTKKEPTNEQLVEAALDLVAVGDVAEASLQPLLWRVDRNRPARAAISRSILAVKADAATRLFDLNCGDLRWAVVDSGIDATHPAFRKRDEKGELLPEPFEKPKKRGAAAQNNTRIVATYDFTRLRKLLHPGATEDEKGLTRDERSRVADFRRALKAGRAIDWLALEPLLRVPHEPGEYQPPVHEHGTHVAGILTADWRLTDADMPNDHSLVGIAAGLQLYDLRVLDDNGNGDEFSLIAALQFVRYLNANKDQVLVHGVNASLSIRHDVANYACGRTPVCRRGGRERRLCALPDDRRRLERRLPQHQHHRPRQRAGRDHRGCDAPLPTALVRRLVLLEPRPDRRRAAQAGHRRAGREDQFLRARREGDDDGRDEHGGAARQRGRRAADGALPRVRRAAGPDQAGAVRERDRPRARALLPGQRDAGRVARAAGGVT